jgi:serine/threonine protein kinase
LIRTENDFAYLIDFGIARAAGNTRIRGTGNVIGTWAYMAPERVTSGQTDPCCDTYALACALHECLTGSPGFRGDSLEQQMWRPSGVAATVAVSSSERLAGPI